MPSNNTPTPKKHNATIAAEQTQTANELRHAASHLQQTRRHAEDNAQLASLPVQHQHAAIRRAAGVVLRHGGGAA